MKNILFVCTANVCRSPLAEGYLKSLISAGGLEGIDVCSAGISALAGSVPFECALETAKRSGFDISGKRAQQITRELVRQAGIVLCMETYHAATAMQLAPEAASRVALLGSYHPQGRSLFQIRDPAAFRQPETLKVFDLIKQSIDRFVDKAPW